MGHHDGSLQLDYGGISMATRPLSTCFGLTFGTLRFD